MDESDHLTLVNAGDEEVVSQEEGEREGGAAGGEGGGCCCASLSALVFQVWLSEVRSRPGRCLLFITVGPMKKL